LNGFVLFTLIALLPLVGVPMSVLLVAAGARYGHAWGFVLAAAAIAIHLLASWWVAHSWLKRPLVALLRKLGRRKPEVPAGDSVPVCLLVALTPGVSYTLKNYLLVLAGAPLKQFFWSCMPAHLFTASLGVLFGGFTGAMTTPKIVFLVAYAAGLIGMSRLVVRRLKQRQQRTRHSELQSRQSHDAPS
jgi:uncharacterized membrane protein YdjX (TVP38/TMEM64 family)